MSNKFSSDSGMQKLFESFRGFTDKQQLNEEDEGPTPGEVLEAITFELEKALSKKDDLADMNYTLGDFPFKAIGPQRPTGEGYWNYNIEALYGTSARHLAGDIQKMEKMAMELMNHVTNTKDGDGNQRQVIGKIKDFLIKPLSSHPNSSIN